MAKTTLNGMNETKDESVAVVVEESSPALVAQPANARPLAISGEALHDAGLDGDFNMSDLSTPRLNIVAKTSSLVDDGFTAGSIVINGEAEVVKREEALRMVVLRITKEMQEDVKWGEGNGEMPRRFANMDEARAAGFSDAWKAEAKVRPMATIVAMVEAPKGLDEKELEMFPYESNGSNWAKVQYTASKSAYKPVADAVVSYAAFAGAEGVWTTAFDFTSWLRTEGDVSWFTPKLKRAGKLSADELAFINEVR